MIVDTAHDLNGVFHLIEASGEFPAERDAGDFHHIAERLPGNTHCVEIALQPRMSDNALVMREETVEHDGEKRLCVFPQTSIWFNLP